MTKDARKIAAAAGLSFVAAVLVATAGRCAGASEHRWGVWPGTASDSGATAVAGNASTQPADLARVGLSIAQQTIDDAVANLADELPGWAGRIELDWTVGDDLKPEFSVLTVQPIRQWAGGQNTLFAQARLAHGRDDRTTLNLGTGYRRLVLSDRVMLGLNGFYDYEWPYDHQRASLGFEVRSLAFEINANRYEALSGKHEAGSGWYERPLDGGDVEVGAQVPYLSWARLYLRKFWWDGVEAGDVDGERYALRLRPWSLFEIEAGYVDDDAGNDTAFVATRLSLGLGGGAAVRSRPVIDSVAFRYDSMRDHTLDKVRRENTIIVERTSAASPGTATVTVSRGT